MAAEFLGEIAQGLFHGSLLSLSGAGVYNASFLATRGSCRALLGLDGRGRPSPHNHKRSVQWRLTGGTRLPAAVHPEPLVGITADEVFDDFGEFGGVGYDVGLVIAGSDQLDGGIEAQDVFAQFRIPYRKAGDYGGVGAQGNAG